LNPARAPSRKNKEKTQTQTQIQTKNRKQTKGRAQLWMEAGFEVFAFGQVVFLRVGLNPRGG